VAADQVVLLVIARLCRMLLTGRKSFEMKLYKYMRCPKAGSGKLALRNKGDVVISEGMFV